MKAKTTNHIGDIAMPRPIFSCPFCGCWVTFKNEVTICGNCDKPVNIDDIAQKLFKDHYNKKEEVGDDYRCPICNRPMDINHYRGDTWLYCPACKHTEEISNEKG